MNKPERPQIFARAQGLLKSIAGVGGTALRKAGGAGGTALRKVGDVGGEALKTVGDAGGAVWNKATYDPDDGKRRRRILVISGAAILGAIVLIAVVSRLGGDENMRTAPPPPGQTVTAVVVTAHTFSPVVALNGEARPVRDIQVAAPATGVRILRILVDEGDMVRQGQPMAQLDTNLAQAQTRAAQAQVANAEATAIRARGEYTRAESIRDSGALSTEAIEARHAAAVAADAQLAAARAQLQEVNARLGGGYVRAPAAGLVIDRTAEVGRDVQGQVLFRIAADNQLEVAAQVAEADALALQIGQPAVFTLVDGSTEQGTLRRGPASIDSRTRTGEALFSLPQATRVRAGMFLRGQATLAPRDVLGVPQASILYDAGQPYVFVIAAEQRPVHAQESSRRQPQQAQRTESVNVVHRANVELGVREGDMVEVKAGLSPDQRIVGSGAAFLQNGDIVQPLEQPAAATPRATAPVPAAPASGAAPAPAADSNDSSEIRGREG